MRKFIFNKLVRDRIPEQMVEQGEVVELRILSAQEYKEELIKKLAEEVGELALAGDAGIEELADLNELLDCLGAGLGLTRAEIDEVQARKRSEFGSFEAGRFVCTVEVPEGNQWLEYLNANPNRYPEVN